MPHLAASHRRHSLFSALQEEVFPINDTHKGPTGVIDVPRRFLMGPGPANADPRVLAAQALPLLGHM